MKLCKWLLCAFVVVAAGCNGGSSDTASSSGSGSAPGGGGDKPLVFFAQANSADPWRQVFDANMKTAAEKQDEFEFQMQEAADDANKQINQVDTVLVKQPKACVYC